MLSSWTITTSIGIGPLINTKHAFLPYQLFIHIWFEHSTSFRKWYNGINQCFTQMSYGFAHMTLTTIGLLVNTICAYPFIHGGLRSSLKHYLLYHSLTRKTLICVTHVSHGSARMASTTIGLLVNTICEFHSSTVDWEVRSNIICYIIHSEERLSYVTAMCHTCVAWICAYGINHYWVTGQYHMCISIHPWWIEKFAQTSSAVSFAQKKDTYITVICHTFVVWICAYGINHYWVTGQ